MCTKRNRTWLSVGVIAFGLIASLASASAGTDSCSADGKVLKPIRSKAAVMLYPTDSQRANEQGTVVATVDLGADGTPTQVVVIKSSGAKRLDDVTVDTIKAHWRWEPTAQDCSPADAHATIKVVWALGAPPRTDKAFAMPAAAYPPAALENREDGESYLALIVDDSGAVTDGHVLLSSGFPDLDDAGLTVFKTVPGLMKGGLAGSHAVLVRWTLPAGAGPTGYIVMRERAFLSGPDLSLHNAR